MRYLYLTIVTVCYYKLLFSCTTVTALCWWLTASWCSNSWSISCICHWVAATRFTSLLSRKSLFSLLWVYSLQSEFWRCTHEFFPVMWDKCSPCWACWTCSVLCMQLTWPRWRRTCLTSPLTRGRSPQSPGPHLLASWMITLCGTGSASSDSNCSCHTSFVF